MDSTTLLEALLDVAQEVGISVRVLTSGDDSAVSAVCRVRGEPWVILSPSDPVAHQIDVLSRGLRQYAGDWIAGRYLPPALRECLDPDS